ncbi:MAG: segregation/condensation protein A [Phycisphaerae bacterium]
MSSYRVDIEVFAGPLDLLLYLVRKEEVDIYDIPISKITEQYIRYIEMLKNLDIDLAGDFLVMAATLMQIKSAMLLPKAEPEAIESDDINDPRAELVRQLLEYKKFKDAANLLDAAAQQQSERLARPSVIIQSLKDDSEPEIDLDQVSIWDLLEAFDTILQSTGGKFDLSHIPDDTPIDLYQIEILHRLQTEGAMPFERIFEARPNRLVMIGLFLALLELVRDRLIAAEQQEGGDAIYINALTDEPAEQAVRKAILAASSETAEETQKEEKPSEPPIPIVEISTKETADVSEEVEVSTQTPIPIQQLPSKADSRAADESAIVSDNQTNTD